ncbi:MAG: glycoside hydrolase family 9 protein [Defluviitaleaceae bacterium]|nr:glycoside hydrolase family 9 protein [Defluviitaleaceae bacterium]
MVKLSTFRRFIAILLSVLMALGSLGIINAAEEPLFNYDAELLLFDDTEELLLFEDYGVEPMNTTVNYARLLQTALFFFDANMCGPDVNTRSHFLWRDNCHLQDANISIPSAMRGTSGRTTIDLTGGFHDAGDHVKFQLPINFAAVTLGWAVYEYRDEFVNVGSLDHAQRILDHFIEFIHRSVVWNADGTIASFAYQVGDGGGGNDHGFWGRPERQTGSVSGANRNARFTNLTSGNPGTDQVAIATAVLAQHYANFGDPEDLRVALALFNWARSSSTHNGVATAGVGGFYDAQRWEDKLALAGEWLVIATGNTSHRNGRVGNIPHMNWAYSWDNVWPQVAVLRGDWNAVMQEFGDWRNQPNTYRIWSGWGNARYNAAMQGIALAHDNLRSGSHTTLSTWANGQMRFLLGANPLHNSYVLGYPSISASPPGTTHANMRIHHRAAHTPVSQTGHSWTRFQNNEAPANLLVGALIGGPGQSSGNTFTNNIQNYDHTEVTCDYNASLVLAAAGHLRRNPTHEPVTINTIFASQQFRPIGPVDPVAAARSALQARITFANALLTNTEISTNGANVPSTRHWTTQPVRTTFTDSVTAAQTVHGNSSATVEQLDSERATLNTAITTFENARQLGSSAPPIFDMQTTPSSEAFGRLSGTSSSNNTDRGRDVLTRNGGSGTQTTAHTGAARSVTVTGRGGTSQGVAIQIGNLTGINAQTDYTITVTGRFTSNFSGRRARIRTENISPQRLYFSDVVGTDGAFTLTANISGSEFIADIGNSGVDRRYSIGCDTPTDTPFPNMEITGIIIAVNTGATTPDCDTCNDNGCVICDAQLAVNAARDALTWDSISNGQDVDAVTSDLVTLSTSAANNVNISWASNNPAITATGEVTRPIAPAPDATGTLVATLTRETASETQSFSPVVTALDISPTEVNVTPDSLNLTVGETGNLDAAVVPENANQTVTWSSSNTEVATVSDGVVTAVSAGTATITATSEVLTVSGTATVTVNAPPLTVTNVSANPASVASDGGNITITVQGSNLIASDMRIAAFLEGTDSPLYIQTPTGTDTSVSASITFPVNTDTSNRVYTIKVSVDGGTTWLTTPSTTVTVAGADVNIPHAIMISDGGEGANSSHETAVQGTPVTINAGMIDGYRFTHWSTDTPGVVFTDKTNVSTTFDMVDEPVFITANWILEPSQRQFDDDPTGMTIRIDVINEIGGNPLAFTGTRVNVAVEGAPPNTTLLINTTIGFEVKINPTHNISKPITVSVNTVANGTGTGTTFISINDLNAFAHEILGGGETTGSTGAEHAVRVANYTVTFDAGAATFKNPNSGDVVEFAVETEGDSRIGALPRMHTMTIDGYRFGGWLNEATDEFLRDGDIITGDMTVTAVWVPTPAGFRLGDINGDNRITSSDASVIAKWLITDPADRPELFPNFCQLTADITGSGYTSFFDIVMLSRWLVGHNVGHLIVK